MLLALQAALLGLIQGITEFLPISSTGHMILIDDFLHLENSFKETFLVVVQLGSILAVLGYFHQRLLPRAVFTDRQLRRQLLSLWLKVLVGVLPVLLVGACLGSFIKSYFYSFPFAVAFALLFGGGVLLAVERANLSVSTLTLEQLSYRQALVIGLAQCLALIPGVSRSAATIIGSRLLGTSRVCAVEFSFFLAIPTMFAATGHSLLEGGATLTAGEWMATAVGLVVAFLVSWWVIAYLMDFIRRRDLQVFGWYRIALGVILVAYYLVR